MSFRSQPWELFNLAEDRTELRDVAAEHPERTARMIEQWHAMTASVLFAPPRERRPVATRATEQRHRDWSVYDTPGKTSSRGNSRRAGR